MTKSVFSQPVFHHKGLNMLRILSLVLSFLLGRYEQTFKRSTIILIDQFISKSRKLFIFSAILGIVILLFVSGLIMSIVQATAQYDRQGYIAMNSSLLVGLILAAVTFVTLLAMFSRSAWEMRFRQEIAPLTSDDSKKKKDETPNAFEQAITLLIADFLKEREQNRQTKQNAKAETQREKAATNGAASRTHNPSHHVVN